MLKKTTVQTTYTEVNLYTDVLASRRGKMSLRAIAAKYGPLIKHSDIQRVLDGVYPVGAEKRIAFGLPALELAPVCPACKVVHIGTCAPRKPDPKGRLATRARNAALKDIYNAKGWKSGSEFDTALLNGETELPEKV